MGWVGGTLGPPPSLYILFLLPPPKESQMTNQFIHEEISMLFCSEKFPGGWVGGGDIATIATSSRSRSLRDFRLTLDLDPSLTTSLMKPYHPQIS